MVSLGEVLELVQAARHRFTAVEATVRQEHRVPPPNVGQPDRAALSRADDEPGPEAPQLMATVSRLWVERPSRFRQEDGPEGQATTSSVVVIDGDHWWRYYPGSGVSSNDGDPSSGLVPSLAILLEPSELLSEVELSVVGPVTVAGRAGIEMTATPCPLLRFPASSYSWLTRGADQLQLVIDAERGLLLRLVRMAGGQRLEAQEVLDVTYDQVLPRQLFVPPLGEEPPDMAWPVRVDLEQAISLVPFTVLVPTIVPAGTTMAASFAPRRGAQEAGLRISYSFPHATHSLVFFESAGPLAGMDTSGWERVEREGVQLLVSEHEQTRHSVQSHSGRVGHQVQLERWGTHVLVDSDLELETLVRIVCSVGPVTAEGR